MKWMQISLRGEHLVWAALPPFSQGFHSIIPAAAITGDNKLLFCCIVVANVVILL